jgi:hypothetical protein
MKSVQPKVCNQKCTAKTVQPKVYSQKVCNQKCTAKSVQPKVYNQKCTAQINVALAESNIIKRQCNSVSNK